MNTSQAGITIVFVGVFQVADFDKFFFIKNDFFKEEEIKNAPIFTPEIAQININGINILITGQQIIITQFKMEEERGKEIALLFAKYITHNMQAVGVNFAWNLIPTESLEKATKEYFFNEQNKMFTEYFNSTDTIYGSYVSKNFMRGRLRLEIKPQIVTKVNIKTQETSETTNVINFAFNFHYQVPTKGEISMLVEFINDYKHFLKESEKIMALYGK